MCSVSDELGDGGGGSLDVSQTPCPVHSGGRGPDEEGIKQRKAGVEWGAERKAGPSSTTLHSLRSASAKSLM